MASRTYIALTAIDANWRQYSRTRTATGYHKPCTIAVGLASCLWLLRKVPYLVMASGHELTFNAIVMNIVNIASPIMAIDPGTRTARFIPLRDESVSHYGVRVGPSVHEYIVSLYITTCSFLEQAKDGVKVR